MEMRQLIYFAEVAKWGNYSKASEELFLSRQALSKAIKSLEGELRDQLFTVENNKLFLSDFGEQFLRDVEPLIAKYQEFLNQYVPTDRKLPVLSIATAHGTKMTFDTELFERIQKEYEPISISVEETSTDEVLDLVLSHSVDVGIVGSAPEYFQDLEACLVRETGLWFCVPSTNPLAKKEYLVLDDIRDQPIVTTGKRNHLHRFFVELCAAEGFEPCIIFTTSDVDMLAKYAYENEVLCFGFPQHVSAPLPPLNEGTAILPLRVPGASTFGTYAIREKGGFRQNEASKKLWSLLENF